MTTETMTTTPAPMTRDELLAAVTAHGPNRGGWTYIATREAGEIAQGLPRGAYQRALLAGEESHSGSTLSGRASEYAARYAQSRDALIDRLRGAGLLVAVVRYRGRGRNRDILAIAAPNA